MLRIRVGLCLLVLVALLPIGFANVADAQVTANYVATALQQYQRTDSDAIVIRGFYSGSELRFQADGTPVIKYQTGIWTLDGYVQPSRVSVQSDELRIEFKRLGVIFQDVQMKYTGQPPRQLTVIVPLPDNEAKVQPLLDKLFYGKDESYVSQLPAIWREFFDRQSKPATTESKKVDIRHDAPFTKEVDGFTVYRGKGVSAPNVESPSRPDSNPIARKAGLKGSIMFWVIVGEDGRAHAIKIIRPLGLGLDEDGIAALEKWKFSPARYHGQPVATRMEIQLEMP